MPMGALLRTAVVAVTACVLLWLGLTGGSTPRHLVSQGGAGGRGVPKESDKAPTAKAGDFEQPAQFKKRTADLLINGEILETWVSPTELLYRVGDADRKWQFRLLNAATGKDGPAFDHAKVSKLMLGEPQRIESAGNIPLVGFRTDRKNGLFAISSSHRVYRLDLAKSSIAQTRDGERTPFHLTAVRWFRSRPAGRASSLVISNSSSAAVSLFWIDGEGDRVGYGSVEAGERRVLSTFAGHVWSVTAADGMELGRYAAEDRPAIALVDGIKAYMAEEPAAPDTARGPDLLRWADAASEGLRIRGRTSAVETFFIPHGVADHVTAPGSQRWSPDGKFVAALLRKPAKVELIPYTQWCPPDELRPSARMIQYPKPGDDINHDRPVLYDIDQRKAVHIDNGTFPNPWNISELDWAPDSRSFSFLYNQRGHGVIRLIEVDAATGIPRTVINEECNTFFDYANKLYLHRLPATKEAIWMSERDGWNHLWLWGTANGVAKNAITSGEWVVREVQRVDEESRTVWFSAMGVYADQDPYHVHYGKVGFDGKGLVWLTNGNGTHDISYSPDGKFFVDRWSRIDKAAEFEVRNAETGSRIRHLCAGDTTLMEKAGWNPPVRFVADGRDGSTKIWGCLFLPSWVGTKDRVPVLERIYAGPHGHHVPKPFQPWQSERELSELGFAVAIIDGMGTNWRSKAFHDVCHKNLGDAGLPDRVLWLKAAAKAYPMLDLSRVGIYGGSAGGQNAVRALVTHGDFYRAAASDCGCHDNRMDKMWWNELWMGWPVGPHYEDQSNITHAGKINGPLLLTVGERDANVDPSSTLRLVKELISAGKRFDFMLFPGAGHGAGESDYGRRLRQEFFVRELMGSAR